MIRIRFGSGRRSGGGGRVARPMGLIGCVFATVFFLFFGGMGLLFCGFMLSEARAIFAEHGWAAVPCRITAGQVAVEPPGHDEDRPYVLQVRYTYDYRGRTYTAEVYQRDYTGDAGYADADARLAALPVGGTATCYVNPANPMEAVLARRSRTFVFFALIPLVFVAIGVGGIFFTWRSWWRRRRGVEPAVSEGAPVLAGQAQGGASRWKGPLGLAGFLSIFLIIGVVGLYFLFVRPALGILAAKQWAAVPCVIERSDVRSHDSDDGTTYSVDILYRYEVDGRTYRSNRYHFVSGSSSGYDGKRAIVRAHPVGSTRTCYVDPADPTQAVLQRGWASDMWFGLIPLVFVLVGGGGIVGTVIYARRPRDASAKPWLPSLQRSAPASPYAPASRAAAPVAGAVTLRPTTGRWKRLLGMLFFAVVWNGITSVFVVMAVNSHLDGDPEWFLTFFIIPFVLIGLGTVGGVIYSGMAMFNPRVTLTVDRAAVPLGEPMRVTWQLEGAVNRLRHLRITLQGEEEATYRRGTDTVTDNHTFATLPLLETDDTQTILTARGEAQVRVPADTMHSFKADHNQIKWSLHVHGAVPRWPDVKESFDVVVLPQPAPAAQGSRA